MIRCYYDARGVDSYVMSCPSETKNEIIFVWSIKVQLGLTAAVHKWPCSAFAVGQIPACLIYIYIFMRKFSNFDNMLLHLKLQTCFVLPGLIYIYHYYEWVEQSSAFWMYRVIIKSYKLIKCNWYKLQKKIGKYWWNCNGG